MPPSPDRRRYILFGAALLLAFAAPHAPSAEPPPNTITHGPMLGRPSSSSMTVWARTKRPGSFAVEYGTAPDNLSETAISEETKLEDDLTGTVTLKDLTPATTYYYRVVTVPDGEAGESGSFRTFPDTEALKTEEFNPRGLFNFQFEFGCGNNQDQGANGHVPLPIPTYKTLMRDFAGKVDFAILNGDWLYEEKRDFPAASWQKQVGIGEDKIPDIVKLAPSITGVWENYKLYLEREPNLRAWHRQVPSFFTVDDHELVNDIYGCGTPGFLNRRAVFRDIGIRAWFDYLSWANPTTHKHRGHFGTATLKKDSAILSDPKADFKALPLSEMANLHVHWGGQLAGVRDPEPPAEDANPNFNIHRIVEVLDKHTLRIDPPARADGDAPYSIGRRSYGGFKVANCEFFLLDTRSHRDLHDLRSPDKPGRSMLGEHQEKWLLNSMKASDADFFFVVSSVNFMIPHVGAGGGGDFNEDIGKDDAWTVFLDQRERLIKEWDALGKRVFVLTGDLHNSFAIKVTDHVWEFASGPHNSVNHRPQDDEGGRPANGTFQYGPRPCEIHWSSYVLNDIPRPLRLYPHFCVVQVNNTFENTAVVGESRPVAFPVPHVIFKYFDGKTGELRYAEPVHAAKK